MVSTQASLSLVYNLERVSKSLHCYSATYQFGIVAWLRLEPNSYSTKLYSLHRRCSFGPVAVALGQLSESFVLSAAFLLVGVVCVPLALLLGVGGRQMSVAACWSCSFGWGYGNDAATPCSSDHGAVLLALSSVVWAVLWCEPGSDLMMCEACDHALGKRKGIWCLVWSFGNALCLYVNGLP